MRSALMCIYNAVWELDWKWRLPSAILHLEYCNVLDVDWCNVLINRQECTKLVQIIGFISQILAPLEINYINKMLLGHTLSPEP